jgi:hypothetical protein
MGIGRRKFLQLFGATLTMLALQPSEAVAILDDLYINRKLGLAFRKPDGWCFVDIRKMGEIAKGQELDIDGLDADALFQDEKELPLVAITQDELSAQGREFMPSINFYLHRRDEIAFLVEAMQHLGATFPPAENAVNEIHAFSKILPEFEVLSEPVERCISDCRAAHYSFACEFRHENLDKPVRIRVQNLSIIHLPLWHRVNMIDSPYIGKDTTAEFESFVDGLRLV